MIATINTQNYVRNNESEDYRLHRYDISAENILVSSNVEVPAHMRLRHFDWKKLFQAVAHLHSDIEPKTLGRRAITALNSLMSGEITAFDFFDSKGSHTGDFWYDPPDAISVSEYEIFANVAHEHPFTPPVFGKKRREALMTSDFLTTTQFHQTAIYNEYYRIYSIDHQLVLPIQVSPNLIVTCTHNRGRTDFSGEERSMINLLAPILKSTIVNSQRMECLLAAERDLNAALKGEPRGALSFGRRGELLHASATAERLLLAYYADDSFRSDGVPLRLITWVESCAVIRQSNPTFSQTTLSVKRPHSTLQITLVFDDTRGEKLVVLVEIRKPSPSTLCALGLTTRQAEVLFWLSYGKTDKDIAELLGVSHRTVHKHLENIYVKLGVETRTAAMSVAISKL